MGHEFVIENMDRGPEEGDRVLSPTRECRSSRSSIPWHDQG